MTDESDDLFLGFEDDPDDHDDPDAIVTCWCGETGTVRELYDPHVYDQHCGGLGVLDCHCGGDFCVCHHHGQVECPGCADCDPPDHEQWDDPDHDD